MVGLLGGAVVGAIEGLDAAGAVGVAGCASGAAGCVAGCAGVTFVVILPLAIPEFNVALARPKKF